MKIVMKKSQFKKLNEENNVNVSLNSTGNNITAMANAVTQSKPDIMTASKMGDPILHISNPSSQNGSNDNAITQHVEVGQGESIEGAMEKQLNPTATSAGGDVEVSGDGIKESITYTKRMIESAIILNNRRKKIQEERMRKIVQSAIKKTLNK